MEDAEKFTGVAEGGHIKAIHLIDGNTTKALKIATMVNVMKVSDIRDCLIAIEMVLGFLIG